jgi:hypothetical protein
VFWVHASNAARFQQGFRDIADAVNVPGHDNEDVDILRLVYNWMRDSRKGKWFLILDNVDDADFLLGHRDSQSNHGRPLMEYIPPCRHGSVLVTSRNKNAALQLVEDDDIIAVNPMNKADAHSLLQKKIEHQTPNQYRPRHIASLAAALEYMPLAMVQAAAFISHRAPRCSVREYLSRFEQSDCDPEGLLNYEAGQLRRDWEAKNSIFITWQLTFEHIRHSRPSAADLLSLMSFFDRQGIPEVLLHSTKEARTMRNRKSRHRTLTANDAFEKDVRILRNYSFISVNTDGMTFEMHRLVQLATQGWLQSNDQLAEPHQRFVRNLRAAFSGVGYTNLGTCQMLLPHAEKAGQHEPERHQAIDNWADLLYHAACHADLFGKPKEAFKMSVQAMNARIKFFGKEHIETLYSMRLVADCYRQRDRLEDAEALLEEVIEACRKHFPLNDEVLNAMHSLALIYRKKGQFRGCTDCSSTSMS